MTEEPSLIDRLKAWPASEEDALSVRVVCGLVNEAMSALSRLEGEVERLTAQVISAVEGAQPLWSGEVQALEDTLSAAETREKEAIARAEKAEGELKLAENALQQFHEHEGWTANYIAQRLFDRAQDAEGREKALVEAVEPFAAFAREVLTPGSPSYREWLETSNDWMVIFGFGGRSITLGELRRFHAALPHVQSKEGLGGASVAESGGTASPKSDGLHSDGGRG